MSSDENKEVFFGSVVWFSPTLGFGFISPKEGGKDIFVHYTDICSDGFKTLQKGQPVSFKIGKNTRDQDKAVEVTVLK